MIGQNAARDDAALPLPQTVALVLQGGGALGSFQAGVIEELVRLNIAVNWVAGISIGAVNAAIIAGNPPELWTEKLNSFWNRVSSGIQNLCINHSDNIREVEHLGAAAAVVFWGVPGFFVPRFPLPLWRSAGSADALSYYDASSLRQTLNRLVDWDRVNTGPVRFSVGAVDVESGNFTYFDNRDPAWKGRLDARHVLASGALPPGLPPVEIDGRYYWDGGLVSNTPLSYVMDHQSGDQLIFQVDLFPAEGPLPRDITDVWSRHKDIQYSSRTRHVTDHYLRERRQHATIRALLDILPSEQLKSPQAQAVAGIVAESAVNIVQLIYQARAWEGGARDFEFSRCTMLDHWKQGREAVSAIITEGGRLIANNITEGRTAAFALRRSKTVQEKQA